MGDLEKTQRRNMKETQHVFNGELHLGKAQRTK